MINARSSGAFSGAGLITALAASLCCITPVIALFAGSSSIASNFSWLAPARPYLIGLSILVLVFAWYQKLKPAKKDDCDCEVETKSGFMQSRTFLFIVTLFAGLMMSFPLYARIFFPKSTNSVTVITKDSKIKTVEIGIKGMTCESCELEVNHEVNKLPGIIESVVSYEKRNAIVKFDVSKTSEKDIVNAVSLTGYKIIYQKIK
jgi:mercuric ion transport protein